MKTIEIGYADDDIVQRYEKDIREATSLPALLKVTKFYMPLTADATALVKNMQPEDLELFKKDAKRVTTAVGKTAEQIVDKWGDLLMPRRMLEVSIVAVQLSVPWGLAFIRMKEARRL